MDSSELARVVGGHHVGTPARLCSVVLSPDHFGGDATALHVATEHRDATMTSSLLAELAEQGMPQLCERPPHGGPAVVVRDAAAALDTAAAEVRDGLDVHAIAVVGGSFTEAVTQALLDALADSAGSSAGAGRWECYRASTAVLNVERHHRWVVVDLARSHLGRASVDAALVAPEVVVVAGDGPRHVGLLGEPERWLDEARAVVEIARPARVIAPVSVGSLLADACASVGATLTTFEPVAGQWPVTAVVDASLDAIGAQRDSGTDDGPPVRRTVEGVDLVELGDRVSPGEMRAALQWLATAQKPRAAVLGRVDDGPTVRPELEAWLGREAAEAGVVLWTGPDTSFGVEAHDDAAELAADIAALGWGATVLLAGSGTTAVAALL